MFGCHLGADRLPVFEWANAATGWDLSPEEYMRIGRRIQTLRQMFNVKQGVKPSEIRVNSRALGLPPLNSGPNKGNLVDLDGMRRLYWSEIGWDVETGIPTPETISALELDEIIHKETV